MQLNRVHVSVTFKAEIEYLTKSHVPFLDQGFGGSWRHNEYLEWKSYVTDFYGWRNKQVVMLAIVLQ